MQLEIIPTSNLFSSGIDHTKLGQGEELVQTTNSESDMDLNLPKDCERHLILSKIFEWLEFQDLVNINSVNRQWHRLVNPQLYQSIKLLREDHTTKGYHGTVKNDIIVKYLEIKANIQNNAKYRHLVHRTLVNTVINPLIADQFFSTFCNITYLHFVDFNMTEDMVLTCLKPLKNLTSLKLDNIQIDGISNGGLDIVQLPDRFKSLEIRFVLFNQSPTTILETLKSHKNLEEFNYVTFKEMDLIIPFTTHYPTLKKLTLFNTTRTSWKNTAVKIVESNPQLEELNYAFETIDSNIVERINANLKHLRVLNIQGSHHKLPDLPIEVVLTNSINLTSLTLHSNQLTQKSVLTLLDKIPNLTQLNIPINDDYTQLTSVIRTKYKTLEDLSYYRLPPIPHHDETDTLSTFFHDEINKSRYACATVLQSLNFGYLNILNLQPEDLEQFPNLTMVRFIHCKPIRTNDNTLENVERHLERFEGWHFEIAPGWFEARGHLYRARSKMPIPLLKRSVIFYSSTDRP